MVRNFALASGRQGVARAAGWKGEVHQLRAMPTGDADTYRRSLDQPEEFWTEAAEAIDWQRRWDRVLDASRPPFYRWFASAKLNTCLLECARPHVAAGRGERLALIWDSPVTGQIKQFTYRELRDQVARLAGAPAGLGVRKGDRVREPATLDGNRVSSPAAPPPRHRARHPRPAASSPESGLPPLRAPRRCTDRARPGGAA